MADHPVNGRARDDSSDASESHEGTSGGDAVRRYPPGVSFSAALHRYVARRTVVFGGSGVVRALVLVRQFYAFASAPASGLAYRRGRSSPAPFRSDSRSAATSSGTQRRVQTGGGRFRGDASGSVRSRENPTATAGTGRGFRRPTSANTARRRRPNFTPSRTGATPSTEAVGGVLRGKR
jgi:hypothetical protein